MKPTIINGDSRREFLRTVIGVTAGAGLLETFAPRLAEAQAGSLPFHNPAEVVRGSKGVLRAVMLLGDTQRTVPGSVKAPMRYFQGWDPADPSKKAPIDVTIAAPGPTFRAEVGDKVEITFLNSIDDSNFAYSVDNKPEDKGKASFGCDSAATLYPSEDVFPNCFHGSSTANLHFHGTHVTPDGLGDNVLVQVLPRAKQSEDWNKYFEANLFNGKIPQTWNEMPLHYRQEQEKAIKAADVDAEAQAKKANRAVPEKMWPVNEQQIHAGQWPQYISGAFPNFYQIPKYVNGTNNPVAGQAPGTHWYHAHKHGSTALHIQNGLAGAFIMEDNQPTGYDGALKAFYGPGFVQNVLVFQIFNPLQNLERGTHANPGQLVNGQLKPTIGMKPNEVQLWRFVNATQGGNQGNIGSAVFTGLINAGFQVKQIAQDGVQFSWENFQSQPFLTAPNGVPGGLTLAGGNRADVLVIAPDKPLATPVSAGAFFVAVAGSAVSAKGLITQAAYPLFPEYLRNLGSPTAPTRTVKFGWSDTSTAGRNAAGAPPHFTIDGHQFEHDGPVIDQCMALNSTEDWILENYTTVGHPFHIHVNPFQVLSIESPGTSAQPKYPATGELASPVWQDVVNIPPGVAGSNGIVTTPGRVRIRQRFVDFTGTYVLHCHILAHEDRGMMQLVRVVKPEDYKSGCQTAIPRHH